MEYLRVAKPQYRFNQLTKYHPQKLDVNQITRPPWGRSSLSVISEKSFNTRGRKDSSILWKTQSTYSFWKRLFPLSIPILSSFFSYFSPVTSLKYTHTSLCSYLSYSCLSLCQKLKFPQCLLSPKINDNVDDFSWSEFCQIIRRHFDCIHSLLFVSVRTLQPSAFIQESEFALLVHCPPFFNHLLKFLFWKWET